MRALPDKWHFADKRNDTGRVWAVTTSTAPGTHWARALPDKWHFADKRNDTERVWAVTASTAPGTHCQRALPAKKASPGDRAG